MSKNYVTLKLRVDDPYSMISEAVRSGLSRGLRRFFKYHNFDDQDFAELFTEKNTQIEKDIQEEQWRAIMENIDELICDDEEDQ